MLIHLRSEELPKCWKSIEIICVIILINSIFSWHVKPVVGQLIGQPKGSYNQSISHMTIGRCTPNSYPSAFDFRVTRCFPKLPAVLTLSHIKNIPWSETITITGKLSAATPPTPWIGREFITFKGKGVPAHLTGVWINRNGSFTATGLAPSIVEKAWLVRAHFAGDNVYNGTDSNVESYNTLKHNTFVLLHAAPYVRCSTPTLFAGTLKDSSNGGTPLPGKRVTFAGTGVMPSPLSGTTDRTGKTTVTGTSPNTVATGWTFQARFDNDAHYNRSNSPVNTYNTLAHTTTLLNRITSIPWGSTVTVTGRLTDSCAGNKGLESKTITFTSPNSSPLPPPAITSTIDGTFSSSFKPASTVFSGWQLQAHFVGDSNYLSSRSDTQSYGTLKHTVSLTLSNSDRCLKSDSRYNAFGTLKDIILNRVLGGMRIFIVVSNTTNATTNASGRFAIAGLHGLHHHCVQFYRHHLIV
jgi:hypothetical protein